MTGEVDFDPRALVVAGSAGLRSLIEQALVRHGVAAEWVADAETARGCGPERFALIVLGDDLPIQETLGFCRHVRARDGGSDSVMLAVVRDAATGGALAILDAGADDILAWPADATTLDVRIATARRLSGERAAHARARLALSLMQPIIDRAAVMLFRTSAGPDDRFAFTYVSDSIARLGYPPADFLAGRVSYEALVHPDDWDRIQREAAACFARGDDRIQLLYRVRTRDGDIRWVNDSTTVERDHAGRVTGFQGALMDVTERIQTERALYASEERFRRVFEDAPIGMAIVGEGRQFTRVNAAFVRMLGYTPEELTALRIDDIIDASQEDRREGQAAAEAFAEFRTEQRYRRKDGDLIWVNVTGAAIRDEGGRSLYGLVMVENITERKELQQRLLRQAFYDPLTTLPNRTLFIDRLEQALARARRGAEPPALLFLDLDGFKAVNDGWGHEAGDRLLAAVGRRLVGLVRPEDTVARFGGDEFTILLDSIVGQSDAEGVAARIIDAFRQPIDLDGNAVRVTVSIGIAVPRSPLIEAGDLLRQSDVALYWAKSEGKNQARIFGAGMTFPSLRPEVTDA